MAAKDTVLKASDSITEGKPSPRMLGARARAAEPWSLYLLECRGGVIYTGIARDVAARVAAHREGAGARFTRSHPPRRLLIQVAFANQRDASRAEYAVKRMSAPQKRALVRRLRSLPPETRAEAVLPEADSPRTP